MRDKNEIQRLCMSVLVPKCVCVRARARARACVLACVCKNRMYGKHYLASGGSSNELPAGGRALQILSENILSIRVCLSERRTRTVYPPIRCLCRSDLFRSRYLDTATLNVFPIQATPLAFGSYLLVLLDWNGGGSGSPIWGEWMNLP